MLLVVGSKVGLVAGTAEVELATAEVETAEEETAEEETAEEETAEEETAEEETKEVELATAEEVELVAACFSNGTTLPTIQSEASSA